MKSKEPYPFQSYTKGVWFSMRQVRWGVLGTAEIAKEQVLPAIQKAKNADIVAIASRSPNEEVNKLANQFDISQVYHSYEDLLKNPAIDAVYVPLPNHLHAKWTKKAACYGKHVLCEKPAGLTAEQVKDMATVCEQNDVIFMESMMYQFHPQHQRVKKMIEDGVIGEVKQMRASFTFMLEKLDEDFRLKSQENGGGSIFDIGCYTIHSIRSVLGEPRRVLYVNETLLNEGQTDIAALGIFEHENGVKSYFDCGMNMSTRNEYEVIGTKGTIRVPKAFIPQKDGEGIVEVITKDGSITREKKYADYYVYGVEYFSHYVLENEKLNTLLTDTIHNMKAIDSVLNWKEQSKVL